MKYPVQYFILFTFYFLSQSGSVFSWFEWVNVKQSTHAASKVTAEVNWLKFFETTISRRANLLAQTSADTTDMLCHKWILSKEISGSDTGVKMDTFFNTQKKPMEILVFLKTGSFSIYSPKDMSDTSIASMNNEQGIWDIKNSFLGALITGYNGKAVTGTMSYRKNILKLSNSELVIKSCGIVCQVRYYVHYQEN
jgi:hypothetical protein